MLEIRFDKEAGGAFLMFSKNRRGQSYEKLHFSIQSTGDVSYYKLIPTDDDEDEDDE